MQSLHYLLAEASSVIEMELEDVGAEHLLLTLPLVDNARNVIDAWLQRTTYQVRSVVLDLLI
jgi:hypothetical protein